jgi:hypothetical protein
LYRHSLLLNPIHMQLCLKQNVNNHLHHFNLSLPNLCEGHEYSHAAEFGSSIIWRITFWPRLVNRCYIATNPSAGISLCWSRSIIGRSRSRGCTENNLCEGHEYSHAAEFGVDRKGTTNTLNKSGNRLIEPGNTHCLQSNSNISK